LKFNLIYYSLSFPFSTFTFFITKPSDSPLSQTSTLKSTKT